MEEPLPKDLRTFIAEVAERYPEEIKIVDKEVEPEFGITAVAARFEQQGKHPALFFPKVRNSRLPLSKVEVQSSKNATWQTLRREADGTFNDDDGIGLGAFSVRLTSIDGQQRVDQFPSYQPGAQLLSGQGNFP